MVSVSGTQNINSIAHLPQKKTRDVVFRGGAAPQVVKEAEKAVLKTFPKAIRGLIWLKNHDGENLNTIITGIGTAFVAPIFIAFNPFSKADKETKTYSAWRQPISAVLAVLTQIAITTKYNNWLDRMASTGMFDRANLIAKPAKSYLTKLVKFQHPEFNKEQIKKEVGKLQQAATSNAINKARENMKGNSFPYTKLISKSMIDETKGEITKEIQLSLKEKFTNELAGLSEKETQKFIEKQFEKQMKDKDFTKSFNWKVLLRTTRKAKDAIRTEAHVKTRLMDLKQSGVNIDTAIANLTKELKTLNDKNQTAITNGLIEKLKKMKTYETINNLPDFSSFKKLGQTFDAILQSVKIKHFVKASTENAENVLSSYKNYSGLVVALFTLPFSCGLLNWVYPRLMEKIMPETVKKRNEKQLAANSPQNAPKVGGKQA